MEQYLKKDKIAISILIVAILITSPLILFPYISVGAQRTSPTFVSGSGEGTVTCTFPSSSGPQTRQSMLDFEAEGSERNVNVGQWRESAFGSDEPIYAGTVVSESYSLMGTAFSDCHVSGPSQVQITGRCGDGVTITLTAGPLTGTFTGSVRCDVGQGGDSDSGGIPDSQDTGPTIANPGQEDTDRDDIRDAYDDTSPAPEQPREPPVKPGQPPRGAPITPPDR